jgi:hypothetical protein
MSWPTLGSIQPLTQLKTDAISPVVKRQWGNADQTLPASTEVKNEWGHATPPTRLQDCTGKTLPFNLYLY